MIQRNALLSAAVEEFRGARSTLIRQALKLKARAFSQSAAKCLVIAPHPDDEVFGMGGTIAAKTAAGAEFVFVLATKGEQAHCDCCAATATEVGAKRRTQFEQAITALGVNNPSVLELGLLDGGVVGLHGSDYLRCRDRIALAFADSTPEEIFYPAFSDSHPDHKGLSRLCHEAVATAKLNCREYRYITWGWYLPSLAFCLELAHAGVLWSDARPWLECKKRAIDVYLRSTAASCGQPYCGRLPPALVNACASGQEFFLS